MNAWNMVWLLEMFMFNSFKEKKLGKKKQFLGKKVFFITWFAYCCHYAENVVPFFSGNEIVKNIYNLSFREDLGLLHKNPDLSLFFFFWPLLEGFCSGWPQPVWMHLFTNCLVHSDPWYHAKIARSLGQPLARSGRHSHLYVHHCHGLAHEGWIVMLLVNLYVLCHWMYMLQDIFLKISIFAQNFSLFLVVLLLFFYPYAFGQEKQKIFT